MNPIEQAETTFKEISDKDINDPNAPDKYPPIRLIPPLTRDVKSNSSYSYDTIKFLFWSMIWLILPNGSLT